jgi:hypothetical protein
MFFNHFRHFSGFYGPPALCSKEEFLTLELLGCDQVDSAKPGLPSNLGRSPEHRADRIVIDAATAKEAETDHLNSPRRNLTILPSSGHICSEISIPFSFRAWLKQCI